MFTYKGLVIAATLTLGACGSDGGEPLEHKLDELNDGIASFQTLAADHNVRITAAASLGAMSAEESANGANVEALHDEIHHLMGDMEMCRHGDEAPDVAALDAALENMEAELASHMAAMGAALDTQAALTEEARYQAQVTELVALLHVEHDAMSAVEMDFMCMDSAH